MNIYYTNSNIITLFFNIIFSNKKIDFKHFSVPQSAIVLNALVLLTFNLSFKRKLEPKTHP